MKRAAWIIAITIVALIFIDAWLIIDGGTEESISFQIIEWSYDYPAFTFMMGFVMGHLFWVISDRKKNKEVSQ